jgi:thiol-disulfide isomerase/thioredoxin
MKYFYFLLIFSVLGCSKEYIIEESIDGLILSSNATTRIINQTTTLHLVKNNGDDVTDDATFYVNGVALQSNSFTKDVVGVYVVEAKYNGVDSENTVEITYHDGSLIAFKSNVMVEDYTGVWCGNCPRVVESLKLASQQLGANEDQLIKVAIHRSSSNPTDASYDPFNFDSSAFEPNGGYPKAYINRKTRWTPLEYNNLGMVVSQTQINKRLGLKLKSETLTNSIKLTVDGLFSDNFNQLSLVVYQLENGFIYDQVNYTTFFNGDDIIRNFVHDHVLRNILTNINGDSITNSSTGNEFSREFSIPLSSIINIQNAEFVAFIIDNTGNVLNARAIKVNQEQNYQFL